MSNIEEGEKDSGHCKRFLERGKEKRKRGKGAGGN